MKNTFVFVALLFCATRIHAGSLEFAPLQQRAQGYSLIGAQLANDALFANPASFSMTNVYSVDGTFLSPKAFSVSVVDTKTSGVGGGMGYYRFSRPDSPIMIQGGRLAVTGRLSENIGIGLLGKMVWGPDLAGASTRYGDIDVGLFGNFEVLQLGVSMHNLLGGSDAMGEVREYALGGRINWEQTVYFSASMNGDVQGLRPTQFGVGAEYVSPYYFSIKGGYRMRLTDQTSFWSAGASILSPRASLHYAVEVPNTPGAGPEHSVGTTLLF